MAAEWSFTQHLQNTSRTLKEEYSELYERARDATQEAQRQGDAQLKAAIAAATLTTASTVQICPVSPTFNPTLLERAYCLTASLLSDKKDVMPIVFEFLLRTTLICLIFQTRADLSTSSGKEDSRPMPLAHLLTRLIASLWIAAFCAAMLIMPVQYTSWCQGVRGVVLLLASSVLWLGEVVAVLASCSHLTLDLAHIFSQCVFSSVLHRAPFCSHVKARLFGFGLQTLGTLAIVSKIYEALPAILYFSTSHFLGVALAYMSDQQSRAGFFQSTPHFASSKMPGDPWTCSQQSQRRALGGFAGGFAGVSSLKCPYPPSVWTVSSPSYSGSKEDISEFSCNSSSTVENGLNSFSSQQDYFSCPSSINGDLMQASDALHSAGSGFECSVYWAIRNHSRR